jgi:Fic family protein
MDKNLEKTLERIDALKTKLDSQPPMTDSEAQRAREDFICRYTFNTNAIEGSAMTWNETYMVLKGIAIGERPLDENLDIIGHRNAFLFMEQAAKVKKPISPALIKQLHQRLMISRPDIAGKYKTRQNKIAKYLPPGPKEIPGLIKQLAQDLANDTAHPVIKAALSHLTFEQIHPFANGNGRTGRLLMNLILMQHGYPPIDIKFEKRKEYYKAFAAFDDHDDPKPMATLIASAAIERLQECLAEATGQPKPRQKK